MKYRLSPGDFKTFGATLDGGAATFTFVSDPREDVFLLLFDRRSGKLCEKIKVSDKYRWGGVYSVRITGIPFENRKYLIRSRDVDICDEYAAIIHGREKWMDTSRYKDQYKVYGGFYPAVDAWEEPFKRIDASDMVMYRLHMRGYTMKHGLPADKRGNYKGVISLLPELKDMGVTSLEFMPLYEFEEVRYRTHLEMDKDQKTSVVCEEPYGTNYWGYGDAYYFSPKSSYFPGVSPDEGMRELVKSIHEAGMEIILEFSFSSRISGRKLESILSYWVGRYHIDGFHLVGEGLPVSDICECPFLTDIKIFTTSFPQNVLEEERGAKRLFVYNDSFMYPLRRLVNHMDGSVAELAGMMRRQNAKWGFVNYAASTSGFTLFDTVCYGEKHNEANGEDNTDGNNYNCSNNHGVEGPSTLRGVCRSRLGAVRNSLILTILSQAVPLINSGDEVLNSQGGNNNPYCQDNPTGWAVFSKRKDALAVTEYVKKLIEFRHDHSILSQDTPFRETDYSHYGIPDLSYHGREPWIMGIGAEKKGLGVMYCGSYGRNECEDVLLCMNFYYGEETFALPKLPEGRSWFFVNNSNSFDFNSEGEQLRDQMSVIVPGCSISIYIGKKTNETDK